MNAQLTALRRWFRTTGLLTLAAGVACIVAAPAWLPSLIVGIGLVVYGIAALSTQIRPQVANR